MQWFFPVMFIIGVSISYFVINRNKQKGDSRRGFGGVILVFLLLFLFSFFFVYLNK
jgi:Kef-type K+ transport system membrane component KefB